MGFKNYTPEISNTKQGTASVLMAYLIWGILPLFWVHLNSVPAPLVVGQRVLWTAFYALLGMAFTGNLAAFFKTLKIKEKVLPLVFASLLLAVNWTVYVYAVQTNQLVEASMGYFICPLVSIFLGMTVLRERLSSTQVCALSLAVIGVSYVSIMAGSVPLIALTLAGTFGMYGLIKKRCSVHSTVSLAIELISLVPVAFAYLIYCEVKGLDAFISPDAKINILYALTGVATVMPFYFFIHGTQLIPLSRAGFFQYITPSMKLLLGVIVFNETFTFDHGVSFGFIWAALAIYSFSLTSMRKNVSFSRIETKGE